MLNGSGEGPEGTRLVKRNQHDDSFDGFVDFLLIWLSIFNVFHVSNNVPAVFGG